MKCKLICLLLASLLLGCSKKALHPVAASIPEIEEINGIQAEARSLFETKDFDKLDALAKGFRDSGASYPDGEWKLFYFYEALEVPEDADASEWSSHFQTMTNWITARPNSITARVALADEWITYAWAARGHDYIDNTSDQGQMLFAERLGEAEKVLNAGGKINGTCPEWWLAALRTELGLPISRQQYDATFNQAIKAWPNYPHFYFARANYLLPRWNGADGELESDLEESANKIGGDAGDILYVQVIWNVHHSIYSHNVFEEYKLSWDRAHRGLEALEKLHPNDIRIENEAAHLAMLAHDADAAKRYFDQTAGQVDTYCWSLDEYSSAAQVLYGDKQ